MRMNFTKWILICMTLASAAGAGVINVPAGPVWGKWNTGDSVIVQPGAYVPEGQLLIVEGGAHIFFAGSGRFDAEGVLRMEGSVLSPIYVYSVENWRGFRLSGSVWHLFNSVHIMSDVGLARQCVELVDGGLELNDCSFRASENCLRISSGQLHARRNSFVTSGLYSRVVELNNLVGFASTDCNEAPGNIFRDNFLKAEVGPLGPGDPIDPFNSTAGLWVENSTNICLSANNIIVRAPLNVIGARFGNTPDFGDQSWDLDFTIVYAESYSQMALGVLNEVNGNLDVSKMTITVRGAAGYTSSCFFASRTAYIRVNSTTTIMGSPVDIYFNTSGTGRIDADYVVKWMEPGLSLDYAPENPLFNSAEVIYESFDELTVFLGDSIWEDNPDFAMVGNWGHWNSNEELAAFFSLTPTSPCIDRGDPAYGNDPDDTRLDIGRFYFHQEQSPVHDRPGLVGSAVMEAAYPNPFNPATVLPIAVNGSGVLHITVWDVLGRSVYELSRPVYSPGLQNVHFDASGLSTGLYVAQAEFGGRVIGSQRLLFVK